jgi:hypothetical protein
LPPRPLAAEIGSLDLAALARPLVSVDARHGMPPSVADRILPQLEVAAAAACLRLGSHQGAERAVTRRACDTTSRTLAL